MEIEKYLRSLTEETSALKNLVRYLIEDTHWQTDGEWKESVVRQILRRYLPASVTVCRGFVVTADRSSKQLDVLICDSSADSPATQAQTDAIVRYSAEILDDVFKDQFPGGHQQHVHAKHETSLFAV
jgi:hypothetical protein